MLRNGSTAHVRPIRPTDADATVRMHAAQSERSIYLRYFTYKSQLSQKELERFTNVDNVDRVALVVTRGDEIIAIGRFDRLTDPVEAEVAFNVRDAYHGHGLGSILLEHLIAAAHELGIERFTAEVLPENRQMLSVFNEAGYEVERHFEDGVVMVSFDIAATERSREVMEAREHRAESSSIADLLRPSSLVIIGGSDRPGSVGATLVHNVREGGFQGDVTVVNPSVAEGATVGGYPAVASLEDLTHEVDLALVAVPQDQLLGVADACCRHGLKGMVVITELVSTPEDLAVQRELVRSARNQGLRVIGPASLGVVNTAEDVQLNASILPDLPQRGSLGLFSQSAALGTMLDATARRHHVGVSTVINAGNRADVSGNDVMQFWEDDPATAVVGVFLESFGNPRKFSRIARRLSRTKPVVVATSDVLGQLLPPGHAVRQTQAPLGAVDAMLAQSGVVRVHTQEEMIDVAQLLTAQPLPAGPRIGVLTNSAALAGLTRTHLSRRSLVPSVVRDDAVMEGAKEAALAQLGEAVAEVLGRPDVDALLVGLLPQPGYDAAHLAEAIQDAAATTGKPVVVCFAGSRDARTPVEGLAGNLPCYRNIAGAASALAGAVAYVRWRESDTGPAQRPEGTDRERAEELVQSWTEGLEGTELRELTQEQSRELLACYGLDLLDSIPVKDADEAVEAAEELGYPVVLRAMDRLLRHRLDLGGVRLNIVDEASLRSDVATMHSTLASYGAMDLEVQAMAPAGQGCVIRALEDPLMGPLVSFGLAGDAVDLLDDWAHASPPLTASTLHQMVREPRAAAKLLGREGLPALDTDALEDVIHRVGQLKDDLPQVALLQLHPVLVSQQGARILHASVEVGNPLQRTDSARRAMSLL